MANNVSKQDFKKNLELTVKEVFEKKKLMSCDNIKFKIKTNQEEGKKHSSTDDIVRLWLLSEKNISNKYFTIDSVIDILVYPNQKYPEKFPMWINVCYEEKRENEHILLLEVSLRFRAHSLMHNLETGHPPFKAIYD